MSSKADGKLRGQQDTEKMFLQYRPYKPAPKGAPDRMAFAARLEGVP
jgi:hypothetical protein